MNVQNILSDEKFISNLVDFIFTIYFYFFYVKRF